MSDLTKAGDIVDNKANDLKKSLSATFTMNVTKQDIVDMLVYEIEEKLEDELESLEKTKKAIEAVEESNRKTLAQSLYDTGMKEFDALREAYKAATGHEVEIHFGKDNSWDYNTDMKSNRAKVYLYGRNRDYDREIAINRSFERHQMTVEQRDLFDKIKVGTKEIDAKIAEVKYNLSKVTKLGQRTKAKMVRDFLNDTPGGDNILNKLSGYVSSESFKMLRQLEEKKKTR